MFENTAVRHPKTVVVPVSKPDTADQMLGLAVQLMDPNEGRVIALTIAMGDDKEKTSDTLESLQPLCDKYAEQGFAIELVTHLAGSVTRGILDGTREHGGELLLLGVHQHARRQVKLGHVAENVIAAAPCDVLVYRMAQSDKFQRIIIALDGTPESLNALHAGVLIARTKGAECFVYQLHSRAYRVSEADRIDEIVALLPNEQIKRRTVYGKDAVERILRQVHSDDLLAIGFSQKTDLDSQMREVLSEVLLNRSPSPVLLASRLIEHRGSLRGAVEHSMQRFNVSLTPIERNELIWEGQKNAQASIDYSIMIVLSAAIASLGLLLPSVAVIIGAMLVAPLMSPLGALSTGLASGQFKITRRAALTLIQGVILALLVSVLAGALLPIDAPTSEMTARGTPTLLDAAIALVSGLVAAYAIGRKEIPAALAGVAIAAALMPPICTIGLGLAVGNLRLAAGASLLFTTNIVFIIAAQYIIFFWMGLRPSNRRETARGVALWWSGIGTLLVVVVFLIIQLGQQALDERSIEQFLLEQFPRSELVDLEVETRNDVLSAILNLRTERFISPQDVEAAQAALAQELSDIVTDVELEVVALQVVRPYQDQEEIVAQYLRDQFDPIRISTLNILQSEEGLLIVIDLITERILNEQDTQVATTALSDQLGEQVRVILISQSAQASATTQTPIPTTEPED